MAKVIALADIPRPEAPKKRSFWSQQRRNCEDIWYHKAAGGGVWWGCLALIERLGKPPVRGKETEFLSKQMARYADRQTIPLPETYTVQPPKYEGEPATLNYGKPGPDTDTLLLNADFVAHITGKGYRMAWVVGEDNAPVLFWKGDVLMGMVLPLISPEYIERRNAKGR